MFKLLLGAVALAYPFIVYFGLQATSASTLAAILVLIILVRAVVERKQGKGVSPLYVAALAAIPLLSWSYLFDSELALKLYPVVVNASFLCVFAYSLYQPPAVITRIASLREELDQQAIEYTHKLTRVWCGFFIFNGGVALFTVFHPNEQLWMLYNGFISYLLMGLLFAIEWLVRRRFKKQQS